MSDLAAIMARRRKAQQDAEDNDEGFYAKEDFPTARADPVRPAPREHKPAPRKEPTIKVGGDSAPAGAAGGARAEKPAQQSAAPKQSPLPAPSPAAGTGGGRVPGLQGGGGGSAAPQAVPAAAPAETAKSAPAKPDAAAASAEVNIDLEYLQGLTASRVVMHELRGDGSREESPAPPAKPPNSKPKSPVKPPTNAPPPATNAPPPATNAPQTRDQSRDAPTRHAAPAQSTPQQAAPPSFVTRVTGGGGGFMPLSALNQNKNLPGQHAATNRVVVQAPDARQPTPSIQLRSAAAPPPQPGSRWTAALMLKGHEK
ncbi:hypothetical protein T484DRAFT_1922573, partial [Baffinella frigidus]